MSAASFSFKSTPITLDDLAVKYGTDKSSRVVSKYPRRDPEHVGLSHNYAPYYDSLFRNRRLSFRKVVEIGIEDGASLRMWEEYFPYALIVGVDNVREKLIDSGRIRSLLCDQSSKEELGCLRNSLGFCDLIVDDGSHHSEHQLQTINILGDRLVIGGFYVIEDIELATEEERRRFAGQIRYPWSKLFVRCSGQLPDDEFLIMRRDR